MNDFGWLVVNHVHAELSFHNTWQEALVNELTAQDLQDKTRFRHTWIDMHEIIAISEGAWAGAVAFLTASVDEYDDQDIVGNGIVVVDPSQVTLAPPDAQRAGAAAPSTPTD